MTPFIVSSFDKQLKQMIETDVEALRKAFPDATSLFATNFR